MNITGRTKITGLFGHPVEHTLSPAMHNAAFEHLGLDYCYAPFLVHPDSLQQAVAGIRALNMAGVNVTVPHKEKVIPFLDMVSDEAVFIGAVNTIVRSDGILRGFNTDGRGFMRALAENQISVEGKRILIAGAGGASRAISYYLSQNAGQLHIFDPDTGKLAKLTADLERIRSCVAGLHQMPDPGGYEIIINATPLGLRREDPAPFDAARLRSEQVVCDLIYKRTRLLEDAEAKGCKAYDGLGMLLWQGVLAFELWTSVPAPVEVMKRALLAAIH